MNQQQQRNSSIIDYYQVLGVEKSTDLKDIKKAYNQLILIHHPDKQLQRGDADDHHNNNHNNINNINDKFTLIQKAWECLRDEQQRKLYDHSLLEATRQKYSITDEIDLDDMEYQQETNEYYYSCRCSGRFIIHETQLENEEDVAFCNSCSLSIRVLFEVANTTTASGDE